VKFAICSAVGQSFIFYTIANFDPLVLSTVTTTRKVFSVLLSIFLKGHSLSMMGWSGIGLACAGILSELSNKSSGKGSKPGKGHTT
jgi:solute carrier family 35 (UDP-galactose transporter), member B1